MKIIKYNIVCEKIRIKSHSNLEWIIVSKNQIRKKLLKYYYGNIIFRCTHSCLVCEEGVSVVRQIKHSYYRDVHQKDHVRQPAEGLEEWV